MLSLRALLLGARASKWKGTHNHSWETSLRQLFPSPAPLLVEIIVYAVYLKSETIPSLPPKVTKQSHQYVALLFLLEP